MMDTPNLLPSTVVMVMEPQLPGALWPIGRIHKILPGTDGKVRVVEVKMKGKTYVRPVSRLIALFLISDLEPGLIPKTPHKNQI